MKPANPKQGPRRPTRAPQSSTSQREQLYRKMKRGISEAAAAAAAAADGNGAGPAAARSGAGGGGAAAAR